MTYLEILTLSAGLLNDSARAVYTDLVMLPYLNIARLELEQLLELNNIPVTDKHSAVINVPSGQNSIAFGATLPAPSLPSDLVEINQVWESQEGLNSYYPIHKVASLPPPTNVPPSSFGAYEWSGQEIKFIAANSDIDIKLDYIRSLFVFLAEDDLDGNNTVINTSLFLQFRVAGLCAEFIEHNTAVATSANASAFGALETSLGISVKGMQNITTRRRPFRAAYKARSALRGYY
jgi:hypothetical protein